jgi:adenine deaminase
MLANELTTLHKRIDVAAGRIPADTVIKNATIVDVYNGTLRHGDVAICDGHIVGIGTYEGLTTVDATGKYLAPGLIDSHIHIESSYLSPEEFGKLLVPCGTTTVIADPHEIVNVCGISGLHYMMDAAKGTALDIKFMLPSCVPATCFENSGAILDADAMVEPMQEAEILGLGEYMNFPGVISGSESDVQKLQVAHSAGKLIDGHSPGLHGQDLNAYIAAGVHTDHECSTTEEMLDRIARGMYVLMRQGSACHDLRTLLKAVTPMNAHRCLLCSDDRQPKTILEEGHIDDHLRICIEEGIDPIVAIRMATLHAAECFRLHDRGGIAPGLRADLVLFDDLKQFHVSKVWIKGELVADQKNYLPATTKCDATPVYGSFHVKDYSIDRLKLHLSTPYVHVIDITPGSIVTGKKVAKVNLNDEGDFVYTPDEDIVKVAVIERHKMTGNVAVALLRGYGLQMGAVALSVAHDSHNIICAGASNEDMDCAITQLIEQHGGIVLAKDGKILASMPLPLGGLMTDKPGEWVYEQLQHIHEVAAKELGIHGDVEPLMTLCFMSLPVIPEIKLTDMGLFDVTTFSFLPVEAPSQPIGEATCH